MCRDLTSCAQSDVAVAPDLAQALDFPGHDAARADSADFIGYLNFLLGKVNIHPGEQAVIASWPRSASLPGSA